MTWAAWGLILDIIGALLITAATMGAGVESGYLVMRQGISHPKIAFEAKLLGWVLLLVGSRCNSWESFTPGSPI